jgi:hypothetical protein
VERSPVLKAVCDHLRNGLLGASLPSCHPSLAWEQLIEVSRAHYVAPALAWCLRDRPSLPDDVSGYIRAVLILNQKRNEKLLNTLARVAAALNAINIEPVLLKGVAHLVEGVYPTLSLRVVGDVDVLVPEDRVKRAAEALQKIGFKAGGPILPENHHHWPMLFDPETGAAVELHMGAVHRRSEHIIPLAEFHENARAVAFRESRVRLPDPTRSVGHNIIHDPLDHDGYRRGRLELRQLLDLAMIRRKHESAIDWAQLDSRFTTAGVGHVLAANLKFAEELFGLPVPQIVRLSERQHRASRRTERWTRVTHMLALYVAARRRDPWSVFKLLRLKTWPGIISRIRNTLGTGASQR